MALISLYHLFQDTQRRSLMGVLLFILAAAVCASDLQDETPTALFEDASYDSEHQREDAHAIVPGKMTTLQLLFHPHSHAAVPHSFRHRIAKRAASLETLAGRPAAAAELKTRSEARTWTAQSPHGLVVDLHVVLWMAPDDFKKQQGLREKLFADALEHFGVSRSTMRMHIAEYLTREREGTDGKLERRAVEEVVPEEDMGDYLDEQWGFEVEPTSDPIRFTPVKQREKKPKAASGARVGPTEVQLLFEGGALGARKWAKMLRERAHKGLVMNGKRRFPRLGGAMVIDVVDHARELQHDAVESPWSGRPVAAKISVSLAMRPSSFWKGGRERVMAAMARYFAVHTKRVAALGNLIQVDMSPAHDAFQLAPVATPAVPEEQPTEPPKEGFLFTPKSEYVEMALNPPRGKPFSENCHVWGLAFLAAAVGVLLSAVLARRGPQFAPARVELLQSAYAKAGQ